LKSRALENVISSVIMNPNLPSDSELWELLGLCCIGELNEHYELITQLKEIGKAISNHPDSVKATIIKIIQDVISSLKKTDQHKNIFTTFQEIDKKIVEK